MAFSKFALDRLFSAIEARLEDGVAEISDEDIVELFGLTSPERARVMLADLADTGRITITYVGDERSITLGRARRSVTTPHPVPSVTKPKPKALSEAAGVERIKTILARSTKTVSPSRQTREPVKSGQDGHGEGAQVSGIPARVDPAPPTDFPPEVVSQLSKQAQRAIETAKRAAELPDPGDPASSSQARGAYQVNIKVPQHAYDILRYRAKGGPIGTVAREILLEAIRWPYKPPEQVEPTSLLRIPASVVAAAVRGGVPVFDLAAQLMEIGLANYLANAPSIPIPNKPIAGWVTPMAPQPLNTKENLNEQHSSPHAA